MIIVMKVIYKVTLVVVIIIGIFTILSVMIISLPESDEKQPPIPTKVEVTTEDQSSWPMFRGEQRLLGRALGALPDSLTVVWKFKTDDRVKSSPAIVDDIVFIGSSDGNIYAIDLKNGQKVWAYKTDYAVEATH